MMEPIVISVDPSIDTTLLVGRTFQIHVVVPGILRLYPITLEEEDVRCRAIIHGSETTERCGLRSGHPGKHMFSGGD